VGRDDIVEVAASGLITVVSGKMTTSRSLAQRVVDRLASEARNGATWSDCVTDTVPVGGADHGVSEGPARLNDTGTLCEEVRFACRNEMACTLDDIERRVAPLSWDVDQRLECLRTTASVIREELQIDAEEFAAQFDDHRRRLRRSHTVPS
jgi:glycerol-3-phosphate dehydrogenase